MHKLLTVYQKLGNKNLDDEISTFDYFAFMTLKDLGYTIQGRNPMNMIKAFPDRLNDMKRMKEWQKAPNSKEALGISKIINDIGITKFLKLDEEKTIKELNKKYKDKFEGIQLLFKLLEDQYRKQKGKV